MHFTSAIISFLGIYVGAKPLWEELFLSRRLLYFLTCLSPFWAIDLSKRAFWKDICVFSTSHLWSKCRPSGLSQREACTKHFFYFHTSGNSLHDFISFLTKALKTIDSIQCFCDPWKFFSVHKVKVHRLLKCQQKK